MDTVVCNCVYPCTPIEPSSKVPVEMPAEVSVEAAEGNIQLHCSLNEATDCDFQCSSKNDLERHIHMVHRNKLAQHSDNFRPVDREDKGGGKGSNDREEEQVYSKFNCEEWSFHTNDESLLGNHVKEAHSITCFTCQDTFRNFSEMIEHR